MAAVVSTAEAWYGQIRVRERGRRGGRRDEMRGIDSRGRRREKRGGRKGEVRERQMDRGRGI